VSGYTDSIFVNEKGFVVETGMSNILILTDDGWLTPALNTGCLPGITRELLIKWFAIKEGLFTYEQLLAAKAVYTCSSIRLIQRVGKVDDQLFGESSLGDELISKFREQLFSNIAP
jgi:branched-subunit amino acid aminotransferase/4-amino-4-deoxychorismate lyase